MNQKRQAIERLEKLLESDAESLKHLAIVKDGSSYYAFDRYTIAPSDGRFRVTKWSSDIGTFSSLRTATSWCIADKYNQIKLSMDIRRLDQQRYLLDNDLLVRISFNRKSQDPLRREISDAKISTKKLQLQAISAELDKCVNLAKYWQIRGFNNETARTGRTASNRTSR